MPVLVHAPLHAAPLLQFACGHCGVVLSVPASMAGVEGPCPACRKLLVAPTPPPVADRSSGEVEPPALRPQQREIVSPPAVEATPAPLDRRSPLRREVRKPESALEPRPEPAAATAGRTPRAASPARALSRRLWTWAAVGSVIGGGLVLAGLSVIGLRRDLSPAAGRPSQATPPALETRNPDDAVVALDEHKKQSTRDLKSLLASQQVVWRFFAAPSADESAPLVFGADVLPLPATGLHSPLASVTLRSKRRLPDESGLSSQWAVTTTRFGELIVEVSEANGPPRINWTKLAPQLGLAPAGPDVRTAAAPQSIEVRE